MSLYLLSIIANEQRVDVITTIIYFENTYVTQDNVMVTPFYKMAAKMNASNYNAIASPMHLYEDGELLTREELRRRKEDALVQQEKKSRILKLIVTIK